MLSAMNDVSVHGTPVDWWFIYKLPKTLADIEKTDANAKSEAETNKPEATENLCGFNYLYYDPDGNSGLALSKHTLGQGAGALHNTLDHIFTAAEKPRSDVGWLLYNDEMPYTKTNNGLRGHCKGVLAFDKSEDCGVWILHSTPRFPVVRNAVFPTDEEIYAQTFIAITLENYETACLIASQLHAQQQPQVYAYKLPDSVANSSEQDAIYRLCCGNEPHKGAWTSHVAFRSKGGRSFQSIAKNRHWGEDFWIDLVGPTLKSDLKVETWRRGKVPSEEDSDGVDSVADVGGIDLSPLGLPVGWHYTHDHAKWATSEEKPDAPEPGWVCVADMNRQTSQEKRGGGSICFREHELWLALSSIEVMSKKAKGP